MVSRVIKGLGEREISERKNDSVIFLPRAKGNTLIQFFVKFAFYTSCLVFCWKANRLVYKPLSSSKYKQGSSQLCKYFHIADIRTPILNYSFYKGALLIVSLRQTLYSLAEMLGRLPWELLL